MDTKITPGMVQVWALDVPTGPVAECPDQATAEKCAAALSEGGSIMRVDGGGYAPVEFHEGRVLHILAARS
jgi:hypothetical protein